MIVPLVEFRFDRHLSSIDRIFLTIVSDETANPSKISIRDSAPQLSNWRMSAGGNGPFGTRPGSQRLFLGGFHLSGAGCRRELQYLAAQAGQQRAAAPTENLRALCWRSRGSTMASVGLNEGCDSMILNR
jgi:hypothetical protein